MEIQDITEKNDVISTSEELLSEVIRKRAERYFNENKEQLLNSLRQKHPEKEAKERLEAIKKMSLERSIKQGKAQFSNSLHGLFAETVEQANLSGENEAILLNQGTCTK